MICFRPMFVLLLFLGFAVGIPSRVIAADDAGVDFFERKIRPVLVKHCYKCHSADSKSIKGGLQLDTKAGIRKGGDSGKAVVPGKLAASHLISALKYKSFEMPPSGKLSDGIIADFEKWIQLGAPAPRVGKAKIVQRKPIEPLWSMQPVTRSKPPQIKMSAWPYDNIDRFLLARLESNQIQPAADIDAARLLRRLHFDLIGLPPSVAQIDRFLAACQTNRRAAVVQTVDALLASPHFGERWARHWLDLVRFSESNGGDRNVIYRHAWRYRDYVIQAMNDDKPYNEFLQEQLAGDLLPSDSQAQRDAQLVATGMLTLGPKLFMETDAERFRMDRIDEQLDVIARAVLGMTVSCARCHDHKFDPISTRDYYALAGIFRSTELLYGSAAPTGNQYGHDRALQPIGKDAEKLQGPAEVWQKSVAEKTAARNKARSDRYRIVRKKSAEESKLKMLAKKPDSEEAIAAINLELPKLAAEIKVWDEKIKQLDAELKAIQDAPPRFPDYCMAVRDAEKIEDCRIRIAGDAKRLAASVPRGFLSSFQFGLAPKIAAKSSGRLELARWLTHNENPLTSRVIVNRVWQRLFDQGLVTSVDNFGHTGAKPSHPQLLDHLAASFIDDGWSIKRLIRRVVLTRTYQLDSRPNAVAAVVDPTNIQLWRQNARRLEVEPLRDAILSVAGTLDRQVRNASVMSTFDDREFNSRITLAPEQRVSRHRTIYLPIARFHLPEILKTFDFADPNLVVGQRNERTQPAQQLFLMNSPWMLQHATSAATRLLHNREMTDVQRVELAFRRFYGRIATDEEKTSSLAFLADETIESSREGENKPVDVRLILWSRFCQALMAGAEFRIIE